MLHNLSKHWKVLLRLLQHCDVSDLGEFALQFRYTYYYAMSLELDDFKSAMICSFVCILLILSCYSCATHGYLDFELDFLLFHTIVL